MQTIPSDAERRDPCLDGWRGLAIIFVLLGHFVRVPHMGMGAFGVQLFFVLSGRLMAEILFIRRSSLGSFYWRRLTRIVPVLYLYLFLLAVVMVINSIHKLPIFFDATPKSLIASATFTYNYLLHVGFGAAICDHVWSLCVEEHTYLFLGLLALVGMRFDISVWKICMVVAALCMLNGAYLSLYKHLDFYHVYWRTDTQAGGILLGCGIYLLHRSEPGYFKFIRPWVWLLLAAVITVLNINSVNNTLRFSAGTALLALAVATIDRSGDVVTRILSNRVLGFFGRTSFSLYIFQQPFELNSEGHGLWALLLALATGLAAFYLVERPARYKLNALGRRIAFSKRMQPV